VEEEFGILNNLLPSLEQNANFLFETINCEGNADCFSAEKGNTYSYKLPIAGFCYFLLQNYLIRLGILVRKENISTKIYTYWP